MKQYYLLGLCLAAASAAAQTPALSPPPALPTAFRAGSYQTLDAPDWQAAKLRFNGVPELLVQDADHKADDPLVLPPARLRAFTIGRDTFDVVHNLVLPGVAPVAATFARRLFRSGGFLVAEYVVYRHKPDLPVAYRLLLDRGAGGRIAAVLPLEPRQFRLALAPVVRDYQTLASQLELDPNVLPVQLPELLAAYGRWKQVQVGSATNK